MNDVHHKLKDGLASPKEDSTAKLLLLQRHQAYLAKIDRITMLNRALCLAGMAVGALSIGLVNVFTAVLFYIGVILLALVWRLELSLATFRLAKLEEALARAGGGDWEDRYIKAKGEVVGDEGQRTWLWAEPFVWILIAGMFIAGNVMGFPPKKTPEEKDKAQSALRQSRGERPPLSPLQGDCHDNA